MKPSHFRDFAIAYSMIKLMDSGKPMKTNEFAKTLNIGFNVAKRVVGQLSKNKFIIGEKGYTSKGFERAQGISVKDVFDLYKIEHQTHEELTPQIKNVLLKTKFKPKTCSVCEQPIRFRAERELCNKCVAYKDNPSVTRMARCGHPSTDRYFACRVCLPVLPEEDFEDEAYSIHF